MTSRQYPFEVYTANSNSYEMYADFRVNTGDNDTGDNDKNVDTESFSKFDLEAVLEYIFRISFQDVHFKV